jgi:hypothetical protein
MDRGREVRWTNHNVLCLDNCHRAVASGDEICTHSKRPSPPDVPDHSASPNRVPATTRMIEDCRAGCIKLTQSPSACWRLPAQSGKSALTIRQGQVGRGEAPLYTQKTLPQNQTQTLGTGTGHPNT